ncbi:PREDICTED: phosphatidylcholine:ceramide cholinephosphotransferase 1-like [Branchiostoma belcheri]|uniref:Phosphatidylcholine:ceramide cholinephosphotransferase 1-like n=1 Tax=Branchiostoma belcheri TaxID=7741 RepID=A0A6P5ARB4_BRABE|nr:PREDICTED: phosphatidylcholine:ceramide cholinephosphotransferase 1-like [Branchiostoma belcheri]
MFDRAMTMMFGLGLSITGSHHLCGDYLFSGHTVILTILYLFIREYSPRGWFILHWCTWLVSCIGIFCILLAHDHYTIDVVVAYYITTRLFWIYHTLANHEVLKKPSPAHLLSRTWWFSMFRMAEGNVGGSCRGSLPGRSPGRNVSTTQGSITWGCANKCDVWLDTSAPQLESSSV